ncbi:MAG: acetate--CoA ligase family protein [Candidatus Marinimicrobia bacterium]|nr:acetate--CoA ligase family protein [Candidatus Neomarinimicrobiota bacterium]
MIEKYSAMKKLFEPRSIAIIGASTNPNKVGYKILNNIVSVGFLGKIYPINPSAKEILGQKAYSSLEEISSEIDMASIVLPANLVFEALKACAKKKIKVVTIISSGFSEVGNLEEERKIHSFAIEHGIRILGPNIFGHYSAKVSLNATFGPTNIPKGNVAIITQSGALGIAMIGKTAVQNIGLSSIISVGNKSDIDEADLVEYLVEQDDTKSILMYIEGIQKGERLVKVLKEATKKKPIVVIKSGRSKRGAIAAASHTGSLAGADEIFDAIMRQCGVLRAENIQQALDWCKYLSTAPIPTGENTVIITNGGGVGVLTTDACEKYNIRLFEDTQYLNNLFSDVTHGFGSTKNPIDLTGEATSTEYEHALDVALKDTQIKSVLALYCETAVMDADSMTGMIRTVYEKYKKNKKPIIFSIFGGEMTEMVIADLSRENIPVFRDVYDAVSCLGVSYTQFRHAQVLDDEERIPKVSINKISTIVDKALRDGREFLLADEGQELLKIAGLSGPKSRIARNIKQAVEIAEDIGYPVVMKVVSRDILHKSDVGGVLLDLDNKEEVLDAYQTIIHNCKAFKSNAIIDGIEVVEQVKPGTEVIIGGRRDKAFGPIIMFGLGGIYVEVMKDVSFRALPVSYRETRLMVEEIKSFPLLLGVRGEPRKDIEKIINTIYRVGYILQNCPRITDIEVNPLMVYEQGNGVKAVDIRVMLSESEGTK